MTEEALALVRVPRHVQGFLGRGLPCFAHRNKKKKRKEKEKEKKTDQG